MKNIYLILVVILLFGVGGGLTFWLTKKKQEDQKKRPQTVPTQEQKAANTTVNTKPTETTKETPKTPKTPPINEAIKFDIEVSNIDTQNRRFDYAMHYQGINYKGVFEDGISRTVQVKKSFGSFLITQAMQNIASRAVDPQKVRGGQTPIIPVVENNIVNLSILDQKRQTLKNVVVDLSTGVQKTINLNNSSVLRTL